MKSETEKKIRILTELADWQLKIKNEILKREGGRELLEQALKQAEPMTREQFDTELKKLEEMHPGFYTDKEGNFQNGRTDIMFEHLGIFSLRWFKVAVRYFLGWSHEAPLIAHLYDYLLFVMNVPGLNPSEQYDKLFGDLNYAYWSSRRWEAMKNMNSGDTFNVR